jgi:hypothetical protein
MTRTQIGCFCAGIAAGAVGYAYFPKIKEKLAPVLGAGAILMTEGFADAARDATSTVESLRESTSRMAGGSATEAAKTNAA